MADNRTGFVRHEGIKPTLRMQYIGHRIFKYEVRKNDGIGGGTLNTIYFERPIRVLELSTLTEAELRKIREFFMQAFDDALPMVQQLDAAAAASDTPTKRQWRPSTTLLMLPEGEEPHEWEPETDTG